nr:zinc finger, CCHC-type [Tanacetum cinerariifolium]
MHFILTILKAVYVLSTCMPKVVEYEMLERTRTRCKGKKDNQICRANLKQYRTTERFVVLSDSSHHSSTNAVDDEVTSIVKSLVSNPTILTTVIATTVVADTSALVPKAGPELVHHTLFADTELSTNSFYVVIDHLAPPMLFSQLRSMDYDQLFVEFNVGAARQTCLSSKVRLRLENELRGRKMFEGKCVMQAGWLKEKDAKIAGLKAQLSLKEDEAAKAIRLRGQVAMFEAVEAARASELEGLKERNAALEGQVAALEAIGRAINKGMQDRLAAGIDHRKARRRLAKVVAYNPAAKANYVAAVNALRAVDLTLLSQLASHKDSIVYNLMDLLRFEGLAAKILEADQVVIGETSLYFSLDLAYARVRKHKKNVASRRLSIFDALVPIVESLSAENLIGKDSISGVPVTATTTALSTIFVQDSTIHLVSPVDHGASGAGPSTKVSSASKIVFEKEELDTTPEHTTAS